MAVLLLILMVSIAGIARSYPKKALLLFCEGNENFCRDNPRPAQIFSIREEMESLIKEGNIPIVIECDRDVAWIFLNDPDGGRDYPEVDFDSDYFETIFDLFPLKINTELKKCLKAGNKAFMDTLGIEYQVKNGEVISKINYDAFERFMWEHAKGWLIL